jgi:ParB-like chromosome segregation protein Spo0J
MHVRDRIKELRRVPAAQLRPHPRNWRRHPPQQQQALRGLLAEIGYADALLARELPDGTLELVDGHLRAETTPDAHVPVLVLDISAEEAAKLLATLDPLAALAEHDQQLLSALVQDLHTENDALQQMLQQMLSAVPGEDLLSAAAAAAPEGTGHESRSSGAVPEGPAAREPLASGATPSEANAGQRGATARGFSAWQVVVDCASEAEQRAVYERLTAEGYACRVLVL